MKSKFFSFLFLLNILVFSINASSMIISTNLGNSFSNDSFDSAPSFIGNVSFLSSEGPVIEGSVGYLSGKSKSNNASDIKAVPVLVAIKYRLPLRSKIHPYLGVKGGFSFLSSAYDSPALSYAISGGLLFHMNHDTKLFFDVTKFYIDTKDSSALFEPLNISAGIGIAFGDTHKRKSVFKRKYFKKKPRAARRPAPKGPRERRNY